MDARRVAEPISEGVNAMWAIVADLHSARATKALEDVLEESRTGRIEAIALASLAEATLDATMRRLRT